MRLNTVGSASVILTLAGFGCSCSRQPIYVETIVQGREFAHYIQFPTGFYKGRFHNWISGKYFSLENDHLWFRLQPNSQDGLLVAACNLGETECSMDSFLVDAANGYSIRRVPTSEWHSGQPFRDLQWVTQLVSQGKAKKVPLGFELNGRTYKARGDWPEARWFACTQDGSLVVIAAATKRKAGGRRGWQLTPTTE
jgi:hypothetical protein